MGFITNQWLKGHVERDRSHFPVRCEISGKASFGDWTSDNVVFDIQAQRPDGDVQLMYLTQDEVDELLPAMMEVGNQSIRLKFAHEALAKLDDAELLRFLAILLSERG